MSLGNGSNGSANSHNRPRLEANQSLSACVLPWLLAAISLAAVALAAPPWGVFYDKFLMNGPNRAGTAG